MIDFLMEFFAWLNLYFALFYLIIDRQFYFYNKELRYAIA